MNECLHLTGSVGTAFRVALYRVWKYSIWMCSWKIRECAYKAHTEAHWRWCLGEPCINEVTVGSIPVVLPESALLEDPGFPSCVGTNISSFPGLLLAGPWNRLRLAVMLIGALLGRRRLATSQVLLRVTSCVCKLRIWFQLLSLLLGFYEYPDSWF